MMGKLRRARTACRATAFALALALMLAFPKPDHAFLTELVVGGELAMQAVSLIGQALPQIMLVAANVLALVKTGQSIFDTFKRIGDTITPHKGPAPSPGSQPAAVPVSAAAQIPEIPLSGESKGSETQAVAASPSVSPEIRDAVGIVVDTYKAKMDLYMKIAGLSEDSPGKTDLADPYSSLVSANEQAVNSATTLLLEAVRDDKREFVEGYPAQIRALDAASRPALIPVLNHVLDKGRTFATLNGEAQGAFPKLQALHDELLE